MNCTICDGNSFFQLKVLWPELIAAWELSEEEVTCIDRQQGYGCWGCGASLRVMALGKAIRHAIGTSRTMRELAGEPRLARLRLLDINGAYPISGALAALPGYVRRDFPDVNMEALPYPDGSFDLVVHSDTLEHVPDPIRGLEECRRVLAPGGRLCFTVPIVVGRLTRSRKGLPKSWHGKADSNPDDFLVHTEYGADAWTQVMRAGFGHVAIHELGYPAALSMTAWND